MLGLSLPGHQDYLSKIKAMFVHGNAMTIFYSAWTCVCANYSMHILNFHSDFLRFVLNMENRLKQ